MYRVDRIKLTRQVIKDLERAIQRNMPVQKLPPRHLKKEGRPPQKGPGGELGWWVTSDEKRFFISQKRAQRHRKITSHVKRTVSALPGWQQGYVGSIRVKHATVRDKLNVGRRKGVVVGRFDANTGRVSLVDSWVAEKLGDRYNVRGIITHEASHAVTARGGLLDPSDTNRPEEERSLISRFIGSSKKEKAMPTKYAGSFPVADKTGFHEHFAEWNEMFYTDRRRYNQVARKYPGTASTFRSLQRYYSKGKRHVAAQKAAGGTPKIVTTVYLNAKYRVVDKPEDATFAHVHFADGSSAFVWLVTSQQMQAFEQSHGGKKR